MAAIGQTRPAPTTIRTPLFILGVALALLAFLAMFAFGILFVNRSQGGAQVRVVVAARDINPREPITADMLTMGMAPASATPNIQFQSVADLKGFSAVVLVYKGQVITANLVSSNPDALAGSVSSFLPIPQGYVAMTIPTSEQQGIAGYVAEGDYINVLATVNTNLFSRVNERSVTRTVFTTVPIIRVGPAVTFPKQGVAQGVASSLTVVLSLCDAQYLDWLINNATLKYVLLSYKDYSQGIAPPDQTCPPTDKPSVIGPALINSRWAFSQG